MANQAENSGGAPGEDISREKIQNLEKRIVKSKEGETAKTAENRKTRAKCKEM